MRYQKSLVEEKIANIDMDTMKIEYNLNTVAGKEQAMRDGYKLNYPFGIGYYDNTDEKNGPFIYECKADEERERMTVAWNYPCTLIPKEKQKTYMTRDEVLGFLANTPGVVVRDKGSDFWDLPSGFNYVLDMFEYEYAKISLDGNYGEPMEFLK